MLFNCSIVHKLTYVGSVELSQRYTQISINDFQRMPGTPPTRKNLNIESTTAEGGDTDSSELILKEKLTIFQRKCTFLDENFTVDRNCPWNMRMSFATDPEGFHFSFTFDFNFPAWLQIQNLLYKISTAVSFSYYKCNRSSESLGRWNTLRL